MHANQLEIDSISIFKYTVIFRTHFAILLSYRLYRFFNANSISLIMWCVAISLLINKPQNSMFILEFHSNEKKKKEFCLQKCLMYISEVIEINRMS